MIRLKKLNLEISNPCNEHCVHCYRVCESTKKGFLSLCDVERIFHEIAPIRNDKLNVLLTGGEVLLNRNWREILIFTLSQKSTVTLFTNGSLMTENDVDFLAKFNNNLDFKGVQISLYSLRPEIHDSVTGLKGSCEKSFKAIKMLKKAGVKVFVSCPVMKINKDFFAEEMRWMDEHDINSCADLFIFPSSNYQNSNISQQLSLDDIEELYKETEKKNFELGYLWGWNRPKDLDVLFYDAAANGICISGDGSIYPMIGWYKHLGNIHEDSLCDVFRNHPLLNECRKIRIRDFNECVNCDAIGYCSFCPTTHLTANYGRLKNLDRAYCKYVHLVKQMADCRDKTLNKR